VEEWYDTTNGFRQGLLLSLADTNNGVPPRRAAEVRKELAGDASKKDRYASRRAPRMKGMMIEQRNATLAQLRRHGLFPGGTSPWVAERPPRQLAQWELDRGMVQPTDPEPPAPPHQAYGHLALISYELGMIVKRREVLRGHLMTLYSWTTRKDVDQVKRQKMEDDTKAAIKADAETAIRHYDDLLRVYTSLRTRRAVAARTVAEVIPRREPIPVDAPNYDEDGEEIPMTDIRRRELAWNNMEHFASQIYTYRARGNQALAALHELDMDLTYYEGPGTSPPPRPLEEIQIQHGTRIERDALLLNSEAATRHHRGAAENARAFLQTGLATPAQRIDNLRRMEVGEEAANLLEQADFHFLKWTEARHNEMIELDEQGHHPVFERVAAEYDTLHKELTQHHNRLVGSEDPRDMAMRRLIRFALIGEHGFSDGTLVVNTAGLEYTYDQYQRYGDIARMPGFQFTYAMGYAGIVRDMVRQHMERTRRGRR
jgi:hypothetical protein